MRFRDAALVAGLAAGAACAVNSVRTVRTDFPDPAPFDMSGYREIVVTPFRDEGEIEGLAPGKEAAAAFAEELGRRQKLPVVAGPGAGRAGALLLEGEIRLKTEVRKAIGGATSPADGPFKPASGLTERRSHVLEATLTCRDGASGEEVFRKTYRETKIYDNMDSSAGSAFSQLLDRIRQRFLRTILGEGRNEERALLLR